MVLHRPRVCPDRALGRPRGIAHARKAPREVSQPFPTWVAGATCVYFSPGAFLLTNEGTVPA
jgi:hypothetical protein